MKKYQVAGYPGTRTLIDEITKTRSSKKVHHRPCNWYDRKFVRSRVCLTNQIKYPIIRVPGYSTVTQVLSTRGTVSGAQRNNSIVVRARMYPQGTQL